jgi:hypothetical protein
VDTRSDAGGSPAAKGSQLRSVAKILIVDIGAPLAFYYALRSAGLTTVDALLLSGVFPAAGVTIEIVRRRRLDVVGALVVAGIIVGTIAGLVSHNARLLLVDGSVPTAVFGATCLFSLRGRYPLMFSFAREFTGPDSAKGREMTELWQYEPFRRIFRVITIAWGVVFLIEAGLRIVIIYNTSTGTALAISRFMPFVFAGLMSAWTVAYGRYHRKKGERLAAHSGAGQANSPDAGQADSADTGQADSGHARAPFDGSPAPPKQAADR